LFSFVKDLNNESANLLKSLDERQVAWRRNPGVVVWAFWIGNDTEKALAWVGQHELSEIVFSVVSPDDPKLTGWNIHPDAANSHVLACRAKRAMVTCTNLTVDDLGKLDAKLLELVKRRD
jgi:hypothetical protein